MHNQAGGDGRPASGEARAVGRRRLPDKYAIRISLAYGVLGGLWIILSDRLLAAIVHDVNTLTILQTYKGWFFVALSTLFVFSIARHYMKDFAHTADALAESRHALSETQRAMLTLLGNLPGMAYRCKNDPFWTMEFVSGACQTLTGYSKDDLVGSTVISYADLIVPEDRDHVWQTVQRGLDNRRAYQITYRMRSRDGAVKWVWEQGCGVFAESGELTALEGYIFDITEKRQLEDRLRDAERLKHVGQAASTIIHDLKNPMHVIMGYLEMLKARTRSEQDLEQIQIIEVQLESILSMSRELLDFARGDITLEVDECDISAFLVHLVETYRPSFEPAGISLSYTERLDPGGDLMMRIDRLRLSRVLMNLISNAREAVGPGGHILVRSWIRPGQTAIDVQDTGSGIPEEIRHKVFEPFVTSGKSSGTGLGLAIAKKIVEAHGGTISFYTETHSGTTFTIVLPCRPSSHRAAARSSASDHMIG